MDSKLTTSAYFTHVEELLKILSLLGVAKDNEELHNDLTCKSKSRQWKTTLFAGFGANIAFVSYDCKSNGPSILFLLQERIVTLPGCPENIPCPIDIMKKMYQKTVDECKIDDMCSLPEKT